MVIAIVIYCTYEKADYEKDDLTYMYIAKRWLERQIKKIKEKFRPGKLLLIA